MTLKVRAEYGVPTLNVDTTEVNVFGGAEVKIDGNKLMIGDAKVASWTANDVPIKTVKLLFNGAEIASGATLSETGVLILGVYNEKDKGATAEINITNDAIYGLDALKQATITVDQEINLLE